MQMKKRMVARLLALALTAMMTTDVIAEENEYTQRSGAEFLESTVQNVLQSPDSEMTLSEGVPGADLTEIAGDGLPGGDAAGSLQEIDLAETPEDDMQGGDPAVVLPGDSQETNPTEIPGNDVQGGDPAVALPGDSQGTNPTEIPEDDMQGGVTAGNGASDESVLVENDFSGTASLLPGENAAEDLNLEGEDLIAEIEEVEEPEGLSGISDVTAEETVTGCLDDAGEAQDASLPFFSMFADTAYGTSYGEQLDGIAAALNGEMRRQYVTERRSDALSFTLTEPITFRVDGAHVETDENGVNRLIWDPGKCDAYISAADEICYGIQAAYDAFIYDYPEIFWMAAPEYSWNISFRGSDSTFYTGTIRTISIRPRECYSGAAKEMAQFDSAVNETASSLAAGFDAGASRADQIEAIHDYLCSSLVYGENTYARTAAGVFLKDKRVVCEGYAKAFKILCGKFGFDCAIVPGGALHFDGSVEQHMWNYVRMQDGNWYLVDATWDDQADYISKKYFLAGSTSQGFYTVIGSERSFYPKFSGEATLTKSFTAPVLHESAYPGEFHEWSVQSEVVAAPTCTKEGKAVYTCRLCKAQRTVSIPRVLHEWESEKTEDRAATCRQSGQKSTHCAVCNAILPGSEEEIPSVAHKYGAYQVTKQPTVMKAGEKERTCTVCKTVQKAAIAKLKPTMKLNATKVRLKVGQSTTKVKVSGLAKGDTIKSWKSGNKKIVTVDKNGKLTAMKKTGTTTVTVTLASGLKKTITVYVQKDAVKTKSVTCESSTVKLSKGKKQTLQVKVVPMTSLEKVRFRTSNSRVAVVSVKGVITAKGPGTAKITVTSGTKSCTVKVTVPKVKTKSITAAPAVTLKKGKSKTLKVTLSPVKSDEKITFSSSNQKVVAVDKNGKLTAKKKGKAVITICSGSVKSTCRVTVK